MLENSELSWARDMIADYYLPGTAVISRDTPTINDYGEQVPTVAANGTVACRLDPYNISDSSQQLGDADKARHWYRLTIPYDTDVQADDVITVNSVDYTIIQLHEGHSDNISSRLLVAKVD